MKVVTIIGARPQFIKASTVSRAFIGHGVEEIIIHTGQHFDANMSKIFFEQMYIPQPQFILNINTLTHGAMTGRMIEEIEKILLKVKPDYVLVYGDTNSTLAGAIAAKKINIKVIHIEAGLRSFNMHMPEEINRILTDRISDYLFCPTKIAVDNLKREGFDYFDCIVKLSGDVMYDCFIYFSQYQKKPENLNIQKPFVLATVHRAENTDDLNILNNILTFLNKTGEHIGVILPVHPRTKKLILDNNIKLNIELIEPVGYLEMIWLLNNCQYVITDSGGLQKEAYFAKKKCITLRGETEWLELVNCGWNILVNPEKNIQINSQDLIIPQEYLPLYGNGNASEIIVETLLS